MAVLSRGGSLDQNAKTGCSKSSTGFNSCHQIVRTQSRPANQDGGYARVIPRAYPVCERRGGAILRAYMS